MTSEQPGEGIKEPRLRQHPAERFSADQHSFNLGLIADQLRHEVRGGASGHRQETLYKRGGMTLSLFLFAAAAQLRQHRAQGVVSIQVLRGHLRITAQGTIHDLLAGHILVLAPGVEHDVVAQEETEMLLTVHLAGAA